MKFPPGKAERLDRDGRKETQKLEELLDLMSPSEDSVMIDVGSGTGFFTIPASDRVPLGKVYAVDIQEEMLDILREKLVRKGNVETVLSTENSIDIEDSSADYAYMGNVLHELDGDGTLKEVYRILKDKGLLFVLDWKKGQTEGGPPTEERFTMDEGKKIIESTGFKVEETREWGDSHFLIKAKKVRH